MLVFDGDAVIIIVADVFCFSGESSRLKPGPFARSARGLCDTTSYPVKCREKALVYPVACFRPNATLGNRNKQGILQLSLF